MSSIQLSDKSKSVQEMFDRIAPRYDFLNRLLSGRQDIKWRRQMVQRFPKVQSRNGKHVDVACGTGDVMLEVLKARKDYNASHGVDISEGMMNAGRNRAEFQGLKKNRPDSQFEFSLGSAESIPLKSASTDVLTISFGLRNVDNRGLALQEFWRVLKPGGRLYVLEFFQSEQSFMAWAFDFYFKQVLPKVAGLFSDRSAYEYLPKSVSTMPSGPEFQTMLESAGFECLEEERWLFGATRLFVAQKS